MWFSLSCCRKLLLLLHTLQTCLSLYEVALYCTSCLLYSSVLLHVHLCFRSFSLNSVFEVLRPVYLFTPRIHHLKVWRWVCASFLCSSPSRVFVGVKAFLLCLGSFPIPLRLTGACKWTWMAVWRRCVMSVFIYLFIYSSLTWDEVALDMQVHAVSACRCCCWLLLYLPSSLDWCVDVVDWWALWRCQTDELSGWDRCRLCLHSSAGRDDYLAVWGSVSWKFPGWQADDEASAVFVAVTALPPRLEEITSCLCFTSAE